MDRDKLYAKTMDRIMAQPEEIRDWAARILTWVCYAARALTIDELQVAIQRKPFSSRTLDSSFKLNVEDIMEFCGGLISINKHTNSVVFFHYTVQEYFNHNLERHFPVAHDMIVSRCAIRLTGLLRDYQELIKDYRMGIVVGGDVLRQLLKDYELIEYSVKYLGHHVRQAEKPLTSALESVHKPNSACLQPSSPRANTSLSRETHQQLYNLMSDAVTREPLLKLLSYDGQYSRGSRRFDTSKNPTAIHIAASLGIYAATVSLIDANPRCAINDKDFNDETAVMIAMRKNYSHLVTLFVQRGAEVDLRTSTGREVLLYAAGRGLTTIADDIIAQVQEPASDRKRRRRLGSNTRPADDSVSLLCAAYHGDGTTITRLLKNSTLFKIAMEDGVLGVCLLLAAQKRKHDIVRILLAEGVDINSRDAAGRTALHRAAVWNDKDLVELLLGYNADVDIKDDKLDTAWSSINLSDSHAEVEAILVKAKADVNTKGEYGVSGLYIAAADGATHRVRRLLKNGTDPNIATRYGWCPLVSMLFTLPIKTFSNDG
jgi:ankyrin repeat protein